MSVRNYPSDSTSGVFYIPFVSGYEVNMDVEYGLPCWFSAVDAYVVAIG